MIVTKLPQAGVWAFRRDFLSCLAYSASQAPAASVGPLSMTNRQNN